jgi:predicted nucleic acid-binding protein
VVIVDTTVWVDYLKGRGTPQVQWLDRNLQRQRLGLTDLILCEVLQGIRDDHQLTAVQRQLLKFEVFSTGGVALALAAAGNYRTLRSRGYTIRKTIDCLIATFCLEHGHVLLHNDRDYGPFEQELGLLTVALDQ